MVRDTRAPRVAGEGWRHWSGVVEIAQPLGSGHGLEGKRRNLDLGAVRTDGVVLEPGEVFSFWRLVGRPVRSRGFVPGRAIRAGVLREDLGGGLCQLSGLIYNLGLAAGLEVLERSAHSRDIYAEDERFAPLGLDATVVWPWKDLRLRNPHGCAVRFSLRLEDERLWGRIEASDTLAPMSVHTTRVDLATRRLVMVERWADGGVREAVSRDEYRIGAGS